MTNKAYIVANEQQERKVLEKFEREGIKWVGGKKPTEFIPIKQSAYGAAFPYALIDRGHVAWANLFQLKEDINIVFDGRKEEQMSEKYVVSQEFMNELEEWKADIRHEWLKKDDGKWLNSADISDLEDITEDWWLDTEISYKESNNRLITIIRWVNGEDVFEVEKPKKWIVRSKETDFEGDCLYVSLDELNIILTANTTYKLEQATHFDTKEEAQSWANAHQEVVEVEG